MNIGGISDSNGPVAWDDYFKLGGGFPMNDGRIAVYPIRALPADEKSPVRTSVGPLLKSIRSTSSGMSAFRSR